MEATHQDEEGEGGKREKGKGEEGKGKREEGSA